MGNRSKTQAFYFEKAKHLVNEFLKVMGLPPCLPAFPAKHRYDRNRGFEPNPDSWVFYVMFYENEKTWAKDPCVKVPIAILDSSKRLRFLIPNNQGVGEVVDLREKTEPKKYAAVVEANKEANKRFQNLSDELFNNRILKYVGESKPTLTQLINYMKQYGAEAPLTREAIRHLLDNHKLDLTTDRKLITA